MSEGERTRSSHSCMTLSLCDVDSSLSSPLFRRRRLRCARRVVGTTTHVEARMRLSGYHFDGGQPDYFIEDLSASCDLWYC